MPAQAFRAAAAARPGRQDDAGVDEQDQGDVAGPARPHAA
jgi:hypothetical protein